MSQSPRIIFYNPHSTSKGKEPLPISLLQLATQVPQDIKWHLVDGNYTDEPWLEIEDLAGDGTDCLLAVTVMPGPQLAQATPTCKILKQRIPKLHILWGGYFPTQHHELVLNSGYVDAVARGPADISFPEYISRWRSGSTEPAYGIVRGISDEPISKGRFLSPDELPDLPYDRVDMSRYINANYLGERCIGYHSSDGCPFFCSFCAVVALADGHWKGQSAERVANTLFKLQDQYQIDSVQFFDNNFFVSQSRCLEFSERLIQSGRKITWWGEGRIDTLLKFRRKTLVQMQRSGLKMVFLGAETSNLETMKLYNKGGTLTPNMTLELAELFGEIGIVPEFSFVLDNPLDGPEQLEQDFAYIRRIKKINPASEIIFYLYTPVVLPGELNDSAAAAGFFYPDSLEGFISTEWQLFEMRRGERMPWQRDAHGRIREFETVLNAFYPTETDVKLRGWQRALLRLTSAWRYGTRFYRSPLELRALHRLFRYIRPEVEGF